MAPLRLRAATPEDVETIVALNVAGWKAAYADIVPERLADHPIDAWRKDVRDLLISPRGDSFARIAELDKEPAGYCYVMAPGRDEAGGPAVAELVAIYVEPARWRQGVGSALMEDVTTEAARLAREMRLWTLEENSGAREFYESHGWAADGRRDDQHQTGAPVVGFARPLPAQ